MHDFERPSLHPLSATKISSSQTTPRFKLEEKEGANVRQPERKLLLQELKNSKRKKKRNSTL